jgi:hypothetical protein
MDPRMIKAFKILIKRYEKLSLRKIERSFIKYKEKDGYFIMNKLTGFGDGKTCILCKTVKRISHNKNFLYEDCEYCYGTLRGCCEGNNEDTYLNICHSETPEELYKAVKARANRVKAFFINKMIY